MPRARLCRRLRLSCTAAVRTVVRERTTGFSRLRGKAAESGSRRLLTIFRGARQSKCEEPNSSCDDRCNAPIIRRECSALLLSLSLIPYVGYPKFCRFLSLRRVEPCGIHLQGFTSRSLPLAIRLLPVGRYPSHAL